MKRREFMRGAGAALAATVTGAGSITKQLAHAADDHNAVSRIAPDGGVGELFGGRSVPGNCCR